jgi:hypothetical protein
MVGFSQQRTRQALVVVEMDDGTITIIHFGAVPTVKLDPLIAIDDSTVLGGICDRRERVIGYQLQIDGPGSMVMAEDFRTAWDFGQQHWAPPDPTARARRGLPEPTRELAHPHGDVDHPWMDR